MKNAEGFWGPLLALSGLWIVPSVEIVRVGWTIAGDFDNHSFGVGARKVIVTYATRFRVHASRGECLQRLGVEMIAVAKMPFPGNNGCYAIVPV